MLRAVFMMTLPGLINCRRAGSLGLVPGNIDSLTGRSGELVEALAERRMDVACVQETRRGSGCRFFGAIGKRYKLFWMGSKAKTDGVGIFVAAKWVDSVVSVERHSERVLVLKMVLCDCLLNVFTVYAPHPGKT